MDDVDDEIVDALEGVIDLCCSLPCNMLTGILDRIEDSKIVHIPVTREEEGVGICAGAYLGGRKPALIMQNSGLGNSINTLLSLTGLYGIPLFILMSHRGDVGEKIIAQVPMGKAVPKLLETLEIEYECIRRRDEIVKIKKMAEKAFDEEKIKAVLLSKVLWDEED
jgi:sulfopyruvate decarboxylase subunit alpha